MRKHTKRKYCTAYYGVHSNIKRAWCFMHTLLRFARVHKPCVWVCSLWRMRNKRHGTTVGQTEGTHSQRCCCCCRRCCCGYRGVLPLWPPPIGLAATTTMICMCVCVLRRLAGLLCASCVSGSLIGVSVLYMPYSIYSEWFECGRE